VICKPQNPLCTVCPLKTGCAALLEEKVDVLPVKAGKLIKKQRWLYYLIVEYNGKIYVRKRGAKEIWENLYEFVLLETDKAFSFEEIKNSKFFRNITGKNKTTILHVSKMYKQQLTHQTIHGNFIQLTVNGEPALKNYKAVTYKQLNKLPFPKFITGYLAENELKAFER
jgi:A/G-specific adenine glycosylase